MAFSLGEMVPFAIGCLVPNFVASEWVENIVPWNKVGKKLEKFSPDSVSTDFVEHISEVKFKDGTWRCTFGVTE
jgi:hypothetical protein